VIEQVKSVRRGRRRRRAALATTLVSLTVAALVATTPASALTTTKIPDARAAAMDVQTGASASGDRAASASASGFRAGEIISDDNFFNYQSMTEAGVREFLDSVTCVPRDDSPCLADYTQRTSTRAASAGHCARYQGGSKQSGAEIIWRVSQACKVSPRVLLILVQKEQSLLTHPSASGYQKATGYGCPDTAACNTRYYGFFNQVYDAAWQFREYTLHPDEFRYRVGRHRVAYSPDAACGSRVVDIRNQATADLYNYTPYQPDDQTLTHPDGPAGSCSAYGNLNFERLYERWFGDPRSTTFPGWYPRCLDFADGRDCPTAERLGVIPSTAYGND
jgi:hypothetical protein